MNGQALHIAMTVAPDLRARSRTAHERIVGWHAAIVVKPHDLAMMVRQVLRRVRFEVALGRHLPVAEREEQIAVLVERDLPAVVTSPFRNGVEQLLHVHQAIVLEAGANQCRPGVGLGGARLRIGEVDQPVRGKVRMRHHLEQSALA
jgi:hypothetical protein